MMRGRKIIMNNKVHLFSQFEIPNGDTVSIYKDQHGHFISIVTNKDNETVVS